MFVLSIICYVLNSISLVIATMMIILFLVKKLYIQILSEFSMHILISEIINSVTAYLSLPRNLCIDNNPKKVMKCLKIDNIGYIEICLDIFTDSCTLMTSLFIALKIYDTFRNRSQFFNQKSNKILSRCIIYGIPFIFSMILGGIQMFLYEKDSKYGFNGICMPNNCIMARVLNGIFIGASWGFIMIILIFNFVNCCFLNRQAAILRNNLNIAINKQNTLDMISQTKWKMMLLPMTSLILWAFFYSVKIVGLFKNSHDDIWLKTANNISAVINSLRGLIFAIVLYFTDEELKKSIKNTFSRNQSILQLPNDQLEDENKSFD